MSRPCRFRQVSQCGKKTAAEGRVARECGKTHGAHRQGSWSPDPDFRVLTEPSLHGPEEDIASESGRCVPCSRLQLFDEGASDVKQAQPVSKPKTITFR
jgi:hypothetical protein